jgi:hypothetical protein
MRSSIRDYSCHAYLPGYERSELQSMMNDTDKNQNRRYRKKALMYHFEGRLYQLISARLENGIKYGYNSLSTWRIAESLSYFPDLEKLALSCTS